MNQLALVQSSVFLSLDLGASTMNQRQQDPRYVANRAFAESLNQLQKTLQAADTQAVPPIEPDKSSPNSANAAPFDLSSFEQAVADIEAFMETRQQQEEDH
jgi:hypothetical protein